MIELFKCKEDSKLMKYEFEEKPDFALKYNKESLKIMA